MKGNVGLEAALEMVALFASELVHVGVFVLTMVENILKHQVVQLTESGELLAAVVKRILTAVVWEVNAAMVRQVLTAVVGQVLDNVVELLMMRALCIKAVTLIIVCMQMSFLSFTVAILLVSTTMHEVLAAMVVKVLFAVVVVGFVVILFFSGVVVEVSIILVVIPAFVHATILFVVHVLLDPASIVGLDETPSRLEFGPEVPHDLGICILIVGLQDALADLAEVVRTEFV